MSGSWVRHAAKGLGVSALNPKGPLLFLALLPQFTDSHSPCPIPLQIVTLGLAHTASCAAVYTAVGTGARQVLRTPLSCRGRDMVFGGRDDRRWGDAADRAPRHVALRRGCNVRG
jgi:threonine/homoserine/homoserine lactone efflux protein